MSVLANSPLTPITDYTQLIKHFSSGEKPESGWLIGCEHEKFAYRLSTLKPVHYDEAAGLRDFLLGMKQYGWQEVIENKNIIGLSRGSEAISFEPGGQVELSGAPLRNLHETAAEVTQHLEEISTIGNSLGIGFLGIGFHPTATPKEISWVPKERYRIMRSYMPKRDTMGLDMMLRTTSIQVNLDFSSEADMVEKFRLSVALQPIATALFASSPFIEKRLSGFNSTRMHVWDHTDKDRCVMPSFIFDTSFSYERYTDYALDIPMYFVYRDKRYIDCSGQSFRDFLQGKLPSLPGELPTLNDWDNHLTTVFTSVRLKKYLELRGADTGHQMMLLALPAFWVGILYDSCARDQAAQLVKNWTYEDIQNLNKDVTKFGLNATIHNHKVSDIAQQVLLFSQSGLRRRAVRDQDFVDESKYLNILFDIIKRGQNVADQLISQYRLADFSWQKVFDTCQLKASREITTSFKNSPTARSAS